MENNVNISLEQIIKRRLDYYRDNKDQELLSLNSGYVRGFNQMLADINLNEASFTEKYINVLKSIKEEIETYENIETNETVDELCGYNNAIVDVLSILNIEYFFVYDFLIFLQCKNSFN